MRKHYRIGSNPRSARKLRKFTIVTLSLGIAAIVVYSAVYGINTPSTTVINEPVVNQTPQVQATTVLPQITTPMPWPDYGYAAYGVSKDQLFASSNDTNQPVPIASLAKVITALAVLQKKPLTVGDQGPQITLDEHDVALVNTYASMSGIYVPVVAGGQISEYQALQATLLVSANNMSDSLARWAFGSVDEYVIYANQMLKDLGLENTTVADASGFSPDTISTAEDMTKIGYLYMQHPVLREIAMQQQANIPMTGAISNYNAFANQNDIIGIKIGNTDEAGKTYLVASLRPGTGENEELSIAVVLGAEDLNTAARDALAIIAAGNVGHDQLGINP